MKNQPPSTFTPSMPPTPLTQAGYVQTAPACGDCIHCSDEHLPDTFCARLRQPVDENARCIHWRPALHWIRANRDVAACYADPVEQLSPAERVYLTRQHTL